MAGIDSRDLRILHELERDARVPASEIAKKVGISKHAVIYRIKALERSDVLGPYLLVTNTVLLGYQNYEVWFRLRNVPPEDMAAMLEYLRRDPNVYSLTTCTFSYGLFAGCMARSVQEFRWWLGRFLEAHGAHINSYDVSVVEELFSYGRSYILGAKSDAGAPRAVFPFNQPPYRDKPRLDEQDIRILEAMRHDARARYNQLADRAGMGEKTLRKRIRDLERAGVITGFKAHVHPSKLGYEWFEVFVRIRKDSRREAELVRYCANQPHITYCLRCIAKWDLDIAIEVKDVADFQRIMADMADRFSDIFISYETVAITFDHQFNHVPPLERDRKEARANGTARKHGPRGR